MSGSEYWLPDLQVEAWYSDKGKRKLRGGDPSTDEGEIARGLACFFAWLSGKGFSRAGWLVRHQQADRHTRRKLYTNLPRALRKEKCRFCRKKPRWERHALNCKTRIPFGLACFMMWVNGTPVESNVETLPDPQGAHEGPAVHHELVAQELP